MIYITEASYKTSPILKDVERNFANLIEYYNKFAENMRKRNLDPNNPYDLYQYYYSDSPEKDKFRYTQYNEYLKNIENLIKKMFKFRSVKIQMQLISIYGPHTVVGHRAIMTIPIVFSDGIRRVLDLRDVGTKEKNGVKYRVGYATTLKASDTGIVDTNDSISIDINMMMHKDFKPKHYVAILLHEIGHNLDIQMINAQVANDSKMIRVISTAANDTEKKIPNKVAVFASLLKERMLHQKDYREVIGDILKDVGSNIHTGGQNKYSELISDALPTAFGYGPALAEALHMYRTDLGEVDFSSKDNLFSIFGNYLKAIRLASNIQKYEDDEHGSHIYRIKKMIEQLEDDLKKTKDSSLKRRIRSNIKELNDMIENIIHNDKIPDEVYKMLDAWVNTIQ